MTFIKICHASNYIRDKVSKAAFEMLLILMLLKSTCGVFKLTSTEELQESRIIQNKVRSYCCLFSLTNTG